MVTNVHFCGEVAVEYKTKVNSTWWKTDALRQGDCLGFSKKKREEQHTAEKVSHHLFV
jgi:hypothetical protein